MADMDKVIEWLGKCVLCEEPYCNLCPYHEHTACKHFLMRDALELLKQYSGLAKALEQSNAVNEHLNAEIERLKLQEKELKAIIENQKMYPHW